MSPAPDLGSAGVPRHPLRDARIAVLGARGPVGRAVTGSLLSLGAAPRLVSRAVDRMEGGFPDGRVELLPADLREPDAVRRAVRGADGVVLTVGVPLGEFDIHLDIARNLARALAGSRTPTVVASSYWTYGVLPDRPVPEDWRPRGLPTPASVRRRAEALLMEEGAAIAVLPDFFGPGVRTSFLNEAVHAAAAGRRAFWPGDPDAPRSFLFVPDVGPILCALLSEPEAAGRRWNVAGSGPAAPAELVRRAAAPERARVVRGRRWMVALAGLFRAESRGFTDVLPIYEAPAVLDGRRLRDLVGEPRFTGYGEWLAAVKAED